MSKASLATEKKSSFLVLKRPDKARKKTIVVLGVERGGTSMVAGVLRGLGVNMGNRVGLNHEDPRFLLPDEAKIKQHIQTRNKEQDVWGFKLPRASLNLEFFDQELRNPHYIIVYRNTVSTVDSWVQRGTGKADDVLQRIAEYHSALAKLSHESSAPILICSYERIVASGSASSDFIQGVLDFIGLTPDAEKKDRAISMISGDGKGYLNLPEHHFTVRVPEHTLAVGKPIDLVKEIPFEDDNWVEYATVAPQMVFKCQDGSNIPERFILELDLDLPTSVDLNTAPLRIYFNFTGEFFPGHCTRPPICRGKNVFLVETSGGASSFALGPLEVPARIKAKVRIYEPGTGEADHMHTQIRGYGAADPQDEPPRVKAKVRFYELGKRRAGQIRAKIRRYGAAIWGWFRK